MTGQARFVGADRAQLQWDMLDLESLLAIDHRARIVWVLWRALIFRHCTMRSARGRERPGVLRLILRF